MGRGTGAAGSRDRSVLLMGVTSMRGRVGVNEVDARMFSPAARPPGCSCPVTYPRLLLAPRRTRRRGCAPSEVASLTVAMHDPLRWSG
jgi:hypothetical protein